MKYNAILRFAKLSKLYKLVKLVRLIRVLKMMKEQNRLKQQLQAFLKVGASLERLTFFIIIMFLLCHITSCLFVIIASIDGPTPDSWILRYDLIDESNYKIYVSAFYFTVTTITTVGFGDMSPKTTNERIFVSCLMMLGVIGFSFATGSLSSILQNLDSADYKLKEKINILENVKRDYKIGAALYEELRQALKFEVSSD